jgi:hypothetical protein
MLDENLSVRKYVAYHAYLTNTPSTSFTARTISKYKFVTDPRGMFDCFILHSQKIVYGSGVEEYTGRTIITRCERYGKSPSWRCNVS